MPIIRKATEADRAAVEEIVRLAYDGYVSRMGRRPGPMDDDYAALIEAGLVEVLVDEERIRGLLVLIPEDGLMLLNNIAVHPDARGKGLGRLLLEQAERRAREANCIAIRLYTHETMTENIALYSRIGYCETHRATEKGLARVFMTKPL